MATTQGISTAEQLLEATGLGRCELVRGELIMMSPAGFEHGRLSARLAHRLTEVVEKAKLGLVLTSEPGFLLIRKPDTVRSPDVAFVRSDRVPGVPTMGYFEGAPDLAVEVLSPNDLASEVLEKVQEWLAAGCRAVWVVDPRKKLVTVHRPDRSTALLREADMLSGEEVVPGFAVSVAEIFAT